METFVKRLAFALGMAALVLFLVVVATAAPVQAQEETAAEDEGLSETSDQGLSEDDVFEEDDELEEGADLDAIEDLLAQDESVLGDPGEGFSYDPGTRRDPFRSLIETREAPSEEPTERPEGKPGLLIDEIVVEGVFELADGPVAQVQSAREETSYLLRPGDQLWDGDVISITLEEVVFKQVVDDPTALKPFREVVKRLNP